MDKIVSVNNIDYTIIELLGHGKGGYSYLASSEGKQVVLKQIHHEPCDYYTFGKTVFAFLIVGKERTEDIAAAESCRRWRI